MSVPDQTASPGKRSGQAARVSTPFHPPLDARFTPGTMLAGRYRMIGLLGRGGMGEVYRADDLKLGQPVALKFLPEAVEQDSHRLARFLNEVRVALQVSHPNVCRVHDIGEVDGQHYISMAYVDGEDLASLLRRIGRFPGERAIQAARELCTGLAAAHDQGILHRDLKPANVMIDGRGRVKITDFGLAGLAGELHGVEVRAGTPAYMAPEQLAGKEITQRSDIYALGLVLYELFTGRPAVEGRTPAEIARRQKTSPTRPSSIVEDLDPAVERVILRCLEKEPGDRPGSALDVAAALPEADPLATGETPSPERHGLAAFLVGLKHHERRTHASLSRKIDSTISWGAQVDQMVSRVLSESKREIRLKKLDAKNWIQRSIQGIKNHPIVALVILVSSIVIGLAAFLGTFSTIADAISSFLG